MKPFAILVVSLASALILRAEEKKPILLVLTNHSQLGSSGEVTGFFLSEASHSWEVFREAGYPVQVASPAGGFAPADPKSLDLKDAANTAFLEEFGGRQDGVEGVPKTLALRDVRPGDYAAIFFAGGHGTMWDFPGSAALKKITAAIHEQGGGVGAVCHGPAALVDVKLSDGSQLVAGRKVAAFTNAEEEAVKLTNVVPFLLETRLKESGATVVPGANFQENAVRDGRLVTGQNPASAKKTAQLLVGALAD